MTTDVARERCREPTPVTPHYAPFPTYKTARDFRGSGGGGVAVCGARAAVREADGTRCREGLPAGRSGPKPGGCIDAVRSIILPELAKHGFLEGTNLRLDFRAGLDAELPRLATEIVTARPDAIFTIATPPTRAARESTSTIPIVMFGGEDAIFEGFAETLARPSANVTAVVIMSVQLEAKRLQLLHQAVPSARSVGVLLYGGDEPLRRRQEEELDRAAAALGLTSTSFPASALTISRLHSPGCPAKGAQALLIGANARLFQYRTELADLALRARLPTVCEWGSMARDGCLLGYGPDREALYRNARH